MVRDKTNKALKKAQAAAASAPVKLITDLHRLPLSAFIDALCDSDFSGLIASGIPTPEELAKAWARIEEDFFTALCDGDRVTLQAISLQKQINRLTLRIDTVEKLCPLLRLAFVPQLVDRINEAVGYRFVFNVAEPEQYDRNIDRALTRVKSLAMQRWLLIRKLDAAQDSANESGKTVNFDRSYFTACLISLSDHAGLLLSENNITAAAFIERLKRFARQVEQLKTRQTKAQN